MVAAARARFATVAGMPWPRPVPVLGDTTSAAQRAADPGGWAMDEQVIEDLHAVIDARRDIRHYRPDPVPPGLLTKVLEAGHHAPSVGHSQPWRFVVVRAQDTRDRAAYLADRERIRQADLLTPDRRTRLLDLKLDGIRDAPVGVVIACDRRTPAGGVLGRASFPDTDLWSCACAIQNMWLAARASGLGMGWVTFFRPADLAELLHLPEGVETLGWMCLGWPDERPPEPGLQRRGWSRRMPLEDVVLAERWPDDEAPAQPVSHLAPADATPSVVAAPDQRAVVTGRDSGADRLAVPGALGVLDTTVDRVLALAPDPPAGGTLVVAGADHPVARHGVSAYDPSVTREVLDATDQGVSVGASTAATAGLQVEVVRARCSKAGDLVETDAMTTGDVDTLLDHGYAVGRRLAEHGLVCLGEVGIGNTTVAAAMAAALLDLDPADAVGLGAGADSDMLERKRTVVARALARVHATYGDAVQRPRVLLAALGGPEIAVLTGVTLGAASRHAPVVLDGLVTSVAALAATRHTSSVQAMLVAGQCSRERAHQAVLADLGLEPLLTLRLRAGEGVGACLAAQMLLTAISARSHTAQVR